jgi:L-histidine Nalpha-methyltransferase
VKASTFRERVNRECGADFPLSHFRHEAIHDDQRARIEMRLVCQRGSEVRLPLGSDDLEPARFRFEPGDPIVTEYSYKYTVDGFAALATRTGWTIERVWTDERRWFSVWLLGMAS